MKPQTKMRILVFLIVLLIPLGVYMLAVSAQKEIITTRVIIHYISPLEIWKLKYQPQEGSNPTIVDLKSATGQEGDQPRGHGDTEFYRILVTDDLAEASTPTTVPDLRL